jgi:4-hydroxymandelate oxidase
VLTVLAEQEQGARSALAADVFDYYWSGAGDEVTRTEAEAAWSSFRLRPWPLRNVEAVDLRMRLFGDEFSTPIAVAPTAFHRLAHADGEYASAAGAAAAECLFVLSTRASSPISEVAARMAAPWWFQVYVMQNRDITARLVEEAAAAGARALVLTADTPVVGRKRRVDGVRIPLPDDHFLVNISRHLPPEVDGRAAAAQDPTIGLETIGWLKRLTDLPVIVKGVLRGDAASECIRAGADGIIVSNHGGRQLDRAVSSALALEEVVQAAAGHVPVMVDGGIRCGSDVLIALALGARAVFIGRPVLWGLATAGAKGVERAIDALTDDLRHVMALTGVPDLAAIRRDLVAAS